MVPDTTDIENKYLSVPNQLSTKKIKDILSGALIEVKKYSANNSTITYTFTDIPRSWYYTRVVGLRASDSKKAIYSPASPWSHHIVAGQQIIADTDGPTPSLRLIREKIDKVVDTSLTPSGVVNTRYKLQVQRNDPSGVMENTISTSTGQVLSSLSGATNSLSGLYFTSPQSIQYRISAKDNTNNTASQTVLLTIAVPTLKIQDIIQDTMIP